MLYSLVQVSKCRGSVPSVQVSVRGLGEGWRSVGGGLEGLWRRIPGLEEDWRTGGGSEQGWSRLGEGSEKGCRRMYQ